MIPAVPPPSCPRCGKAAESEVAVAWHVAHCLPDVSPHDALHAIYRTPCTEGPEAELSD
jgi:hypothetical protein